jgi:hypothetical protein
MSTDPTTRIAAGVTAAYVLDLIRRPQPAAAIPDRRRDGGRSHRVLATPARRSRDDCPPALNAA